MRAETNGEAANIIDCSLPPCPDLTRIYTEQCRPAPHWTWRSQQFHLVIHPIFSASVQSIPISFIHCDCMASLRLSFVLVVILASVCSCVHQPPTPPTI